MANPVRPLESAPELSVSQSAGPAPVPWNNLPSDTPPVPPAGAVIIAEPAQCGSPALNGTAERLGNAVGSAVVKVRELPRRLEEMKQRFTVVRGRATEDAATAASEWKHSARQRLHLARNRAQLLADEYPLQVILGAAGIAFVVGFMLRIWRWNHGRD